MISLGPGITKLNSVVYLASYSWAEVINIMLMCDMKTKSRQSQGVPLKKFMSAQRNQTEDVQLAGINMKIKWIDDSQGVTLEKFMSIEMVAVKSCKSPVYSRWNGWQNIIIEIEYGDTGMDKADENSQYLETYDAMRKLTENEREAKDPITEQINKYARNEGRRYQEPSEISKIDPSTDSKVEGASSQRRARSAGAFPRNSARRTGRTTTS